MSGENLRRAFDIANQSIKKRAQYEDLSSFYAIKLVVPSSVKLSDVIIWCEDNSTGDFFWGEEPDSTHTPVVVFRFQLRDDAVKFAMGFC